WLSIRRGHGIAAPAEYWDLAFSGTRQIGEEAACEELIERLREAVTIRLISEVPLGAFLSGGVDSSAVVALMAERSAEPVNSFSIGFNQAEYDETTYAERVATRYGTRHHRRIVDADDFALVTQLASIYDEPFADASAIPTFRVCAAAREHVAVALSGDGGDELFAGYRRYRWHGIEEAIRGACPAMLRRAAFGALGRLYPKLDWAPRRLRAKSTLLELAADTLDGYIRSVSVIKDEVRGRLFTPRFVRELQGYRAREQLARYFAKAPSDNPLLQAQYVDLKTYLPGDILTKVDRASMASSLEVRAPMLDHQFAEWTTALPPRLKLRRGTGKYVLKRALQSRLPHDILYRPKQGFSVPLAAWFRGPLKARLRGAVGSMRLADTGWFDGAVIARAVERHIAGTGDHSALLWSLLMFEAFLRDVDDAPSATATPDAAPRVGAVA
ncbi:MAG: 7-cyano-7-deazaguanine synthase, partial [Alphaproteobacteria bacterium]|nr:7-cyano-7-deazaguanine synthase [Alphaproteobacteria bacterium]